MAKQMCQSCGMPIKKDELKGSENDGSLSQKYCKMCYGKGAFLQPNATVEGMQAVCFKVLHEEKHWPKFLAKMATNGIPKLERWKT